ncbi:hypothetical protein ACU5AX_20345 [Sphingomonas sp. XXL09]|uniref:hypothetical protein n=1 Tax=Sphingomonas sp. XXL09 TaxID=3457787 RepID=UPI00406BB436
MTNDEAFRTICMLRVSRAPISATLARAIFNSIEAGYYALIPGVWDAHVGYVIWARVCQETVNTLSRTNCLPAFQYEWDEGAINLIIDVFYWNSGHRLRRNTLKGVLPPDVDQVAYFKDGRLKLMRRVGERLRLVEPNKFFVEPLL